MSNVNDWNSRVIKEFRQNGGKVSGQFAGMPLLLLNTTGAKSGQVRTTPLAYFVDGDRLVIVASHLGAPKHPDWYHNIVAHPQVTVEVGDQSFQTTALIAEGAERERLWSTMSATTSILNEHQAKTTRQIPLVILPR